MQQGLRKWRRVIQSFVRCSTSPLPHLTSCLQSARKSWAAALCCRCPKTWLIRIYVGRALSNFTTSLHPSSLPSPPPYPRCSAKDGGGNCSAGRRATANSGRGKSLVGAAGHFPLTCPVSATQASALPAEGALSMQQRTTQLVHEAAYHISALGPLLSQVRWVTSPRIPLSPSPTSCLHHPLFPPSVG